MSSASTVFDITVAFLVANPIPTVGGRMPIGPSDAEWVPFCHLLGWARWIFTIFGSVMVLVVGGKFAYQRLRHGKTDSPKLISANVLACIVIATAPHLVYAQLP